MDAQVAAPPRTSWVFVTCWRCSGKFSRRADVTDVASEICLECQMLHVSYAEPSGKTHEILVMRGRRHDQA